MNRRSFLTAISCLPFLGFLKPAPSPFWEMMIRNEEAYDDVFNIKRIQCLTEKCLKENTSKLIGNRMLTPQEFADQTDELLQKIIDSP